jgi:hypothetical protein
VTNRQHSTRADALRSRDGHVRKRMGLTLGVTGCDESVAIHQPTEAGCATYGSSTNRQLFARQAALTSSWSNMFSEIASSEPVTMSQCNRSVPPTYVVFT